MAELSYDMIRKIRSVADRYTKIERDREAEVVESRRAEAAAGVHPPSGGGRGAAPRRDRPARP